MIQLQRLFLRQLNDAPSVIPSGSAEQSKRILVKM
jgi:hypothetical protein